MNEANKIIGRDFVVAFFVPAVVLVAAGAWILNAFGVLPLWLQVAGADPLKDSTFLALLTMVVAFFLMALNRPVFRALEGYWFFGLGHRLAYWQRWRFRRLHNRINDLNEELKNDAASKNSDERGRLLRKAANEFPAREDLVMFTSFGNAVRAFEDYPRVMYGFESIQGWSRLNVVMDKSYRETLGSRRAMTDFWVNLWFVSALIVAEYLILEFRLHRGLTLSWIPGVGVAACLAAASQARNAAGQWGEWVKAAFDLYLPLLLKTWGFTRPPSMPAEREMWTTLSQAMVYRNPGSLDAMEALRTVIEPSSPARPLVDSDEESITD